MDWIIRPLRLSSQSSIRLFPSRLPTGLDRGATVLEGSGSYTGSPRPVLMSAVRQKELPEIKAIVREIDPEAFVILLPAHQVLGEGFRGTGEEL